MLCGHKLALGFSLDPTEDPITAVDIHLQEQKLSLVLFSFKLFVSKTTTTNIYLLSTFFMLAAIIGNISPNSATFDHQKRVPDFLMSLNSVPACSCICVGIRAAWCFVLLALE